MSKEFTTIRQAAKRLGVAHTTAMNHLKHKRFPLHREAPWTEDDMVEWAAWARETLQPNRNDPAHAGRTTEPPRDEQSKDYWLARKYRAQALEQEKKLYEEDQRKRIQQEKKKAQEEKQRKEAEKRAAQAAQA